MTFSCAILQPRDQDARAAGETASLIEQRDRAILFTPAGRTAVDWVFAAQMLVYLMAAARTVREQRDIAELQGRVIAA